jgi:hypothetical protein
MNDRFFEKLIMSDEDCSQFTAYVNKHKKILYEFSSSHSTMSVS